MKPIEQMEDWELEEALEAEQIVICLGSGESYMFEGTVKHWADCFFSSPCLDTIRDFTKREGVSLEFKENK